MLPSNSSDSEGYGRVGREAAALGIPTIANLRYGLVELLGAAALWADRNNLDSWLEAIDLLEDLAEYQTAAARAQAHYAKMQMTAAEDVQHLMDLMQREAIPSVSGRGEFTPD